MNFGIGRPEPIFESVSCFLQLKLLYVLDGRNFSEIWTPRPAPGRGEGQPAKSAVLLMENAGLHHKRSKSLRFSSISCPNGPAPSLFSLLSFSLFLFSLACGSPAQACSLHGMGTNNQVVHHPQQCCGWQANSCHIGSRSRAPLPCRCWRR